MSPVGRLLAKLPDARHTGDRWSAKCPAHEDRRASLSIGEGDDGRALVHCHAGCEPAAICTAVGLRLADLMPPADQPPNGKEHQQKPCIVAWIRSRRAEVMDQSPLVRLKTKRCKTLRKKERKCMGIEPTCRAVHARHSDFEDRGRHQACRHFQAGEASSKRAAAELKPTSQAGFCQPWKGEIPCSALERR